MAITVYQGSHGRQYTFQLLEKDGKTPRNITGLIVTWRLKDQSNPNNLVALSSIITDATNGFFYVTMDVSLSGIAPKDWDSEFEVADGAGSLLDPSEPIVVNVVKTAAVAG